MPGFVAGYKIDQSCEDKGVAADIRNAMTSAFEMVSAAYTTLTSPPLSADARELLEFLFAKQGVNPDQLLQQGKLEKTVRLLENIQGHMEKEVTGDTLVSPMDVVRRLGNWFLLGDNADLSMLDHFLSLRSLGACWRKGESLGRY
jgi:hypothetical protein